MKSIIILGAIVLSAASDALSLPNYKDQNLLSRHLYDDHDESSLYTRHVNYIEYARLARELSTSLQKRAFEIEGLLIDDHGMSSRSLHRRTKPKTCKNTYGREPGQGPCQQIIHQENNGGPLKKFCDSRCKSLYHSGETSKRLAAQRERSNRTCKQCKEPLPPTATGYVKYCPPPKRCRAIFNNSQRTKTRGGQSSSAQPATNPGQPPPEEEENSEFGMENLFDFKAYDEDHRHQVNTGVSSSRRTSPGLM